MSKQYFTELQPKDGQTVLHCEHVAIGGPGHFFTLGDGAPFTRPDGNKATAHWIAICDDCYALHWKTPIGAVSMDSQWIGDEPVIKADPQ